MIFYGLLAASISTAAESAFLLAGSFCGPAGFASAPATPWLITNCVAFVCWVTALAASVFGKGRSRFPLAVWALLLLAVNYTVVGVSQIS